MCLLPNKKKIVLSRCHRIYCCRLFFSSSRYRHIESGIYYDTCHSTCGHFNCLKIYCVATKMFYFFRQTLFIGPGLSDSFIWFSETLEYLKPENKSELPIKSKFNLQVSAMKSCCILLVAGRTIVFVYVSC